MPTREAGTDWSYPTTFRGYLNHPHMRYRIMATAVISLLSFLVMLYAPTIANGMVGWIGAAWLVAFFAVHGKSFLMDRPDVKRQTFNDAVASIDIPRTRADAPVVGPTTSVPTSPNAYVRTCVHSQSDNSSVESLGDGLLLVKNPMVDDTDAELLARIESRRTNRAALEMYPEAKKPYGWTAEDDAVLERIRARRRAENPTPLDILAAEGERPSWERRRQDVADWYREEKAAGRLTFGVRMEPNADGEIRVSMSDAELVRAENGDVIVRSVDTFLYSDAVEPSMAKTYSLRDFDKDLESEPVNRSGVTYITGNNALPKVVTRMPDLSKVPAEEMTLPLAEVNPYVLDKDSPEYDAVLKSDWFTELTTASETTPKGVKPASRLFNPEMDARVKKPRVEKSDTDGGLKRGQLSLHSAMSGVGKSRLFAIDYETRRPVEVGTVTGDLHIEGVVTSPVAPSKSVSFDAQAHMRGKMEDAVAKILADLDAGRLQVPRKRRPPVQRNDVYNLLKDGRWWSLERLAQETGYSVASLSARVRDLRKAQYGGHTVERKYQNGRYCYRLILVD